MKTKSKKFLALLLVLTLIMSLFGGLLINAQAADTTTNLAFTSDFHYDTSYKQNNLDLWLTNMKNVVTSVDYMGFCGDNGSAYAKTPAIYWGDVQAAMDTADKYVASGFIAKGSIFAFGNHEWYPSAGGDYANNKTNPTAMKLVPPIGEVVKTDSYIIYSFAATSGTANYPSSDIATLKAYLDKAPTNIPIILMTHFPLHSFSGRTTANAVAVVDALNNYPNVIVLWGHNHTVSDPSYDKVFTAGDTITVAAGTNKKINFTYAAAGCMSDSEYGAGSHFVVGKGLLLSVTGSKATLTYYSMDGKALASSKTIDAAAAAAASPSASASPATHTVQLSRQTVSVNGVAKGNPAYAIDGNNYYKLRDIAYLLNGTGSQFSIAFDASTIKCVTGAAYTPVGGEMAVGQDLSATLEPSTMSLSIDGKAVDIAAFKLGGNNFFKLRELAAALNFKVDYDDKTDTVLINSVEKSAVVDKGDPIGKVYFFASVDAAICEDTKGNQIVYYPINIYKGDTIADAITTLHKEAYGDGTAWGTEKIATYGDVLNKLWGKACGSMTYGGGLWTDFSTGKHADPTAAAADGMIIYLNNNTGTLYYRTGYFDKQYAELKAGDSLTLTFNRCSGDNAVKLCTSAAVSVNGAAAGTTDATTAKITLKFDKAGTYVVTGAALNSYGVGICYVVVK
jgi:hypothetical protein